MSDEVLYLYAVTDSDIEDVEVIEMRAVDGAPVHVIAEASVAAVVSAVDADRFSESAVRHSMEDLHWLETIARAHNAVVSDLARRRPVAPVRLATMFANIENVRSNISMLRRTCSSSGAKGVMLKVLVGWAVGSPSRKKSSKLIRKSSA